MKIQILGTGCPSCVKLTRNVEAALREMGTEAEIEKVTDIDRIVALGVMMTPGLAVDGVVKSSGRVLSPEEVRALLS